MSSSTQNDSSPTVIAEFESQIHHLQKQIQNKNEQIATLNHTITELRDQLDNEKAQNADLHKLIKAKDNELFEAGGFNLAKDNLLEQRDALIEKYKREIAQLKCCQLKDLTVTNPQSTKICTLTLSDKPVNQNSQDKDELVRLEKQNKKLSRENLKLINELKSLTCEGFLSKLTENSDFYSIQDNVLNSDSPLSNQPVQKLPQNHQLSAHKQSEEPEVPKKRKLLRKPKIQVDMDTFATTSINS